MGTTDMVVRLVCTAPRQVTGQHARAIRKIRAARRRWRRCVVCLPAHADGRIPCRVRSARNGRRATLHANAEVRWNHRLQVIIPYVHHVPAAGG